MSPERTILLVEDEAEVRNRMRAALETAGYTVAEATQGDVAIPLATRLRPDAIILDVILPGIDGYEVLRRLKDDPITSNIPIIIHSALPAEHGSDEFGIVQHLLKPCSDELLVTTIRRVLMPRQRGTKPRVLIADDEPDIVEIVTIYLQESGYEPIQAFDGYAAVSQIKRHQPAAVILDIQMPKLDGLQVVKLVKQDQELRNIPVIILTGALTTQRDQERGKELGAARYLTKPFEGAALMREVASVIQESKQ